MHPGLRRSAGLVRRGTLRPTDIASGIEVMLLNGRTPRSLDRVSRLRISLQSRAVPIALAVTAIIVAACKSGGGSGY